VGNKTPNRKKQVLSLYISMVLGVFVGVGGSVINTRILGPQQYGDLKFIQTLFAFVVVFLTLGLFVTGSRLLARDEYKDIENKLIGGIFVLASVVSLIMSTVLLIISIYYDHIFDNNLKEVIKLFIPFLFVFPFKVCLENILQGSNRIYALSVFKIMPQLCYMIVAFSINYYYVKLSLPLALAIQFSVLATVIFLMIIYLKPDFKRYKKNIGLIWTENKTYGLHVYFGSIVGVASAHLGGLVVAYFIDTIHVGYYALAFTITAPLTMIPSTVGTTFFKKFANTDKIPGKVILATLGLSSIVIGVFYFIIDDLIILLYSDEFIRVIPLAYIMAPGCIMHGFGDLFNRFLGAHGRGKDLRNTAFCVGTTNIIGFIVLIDNFGITGAASTKLISGTVYCFVLYIYYYKYRIKMRTL